MLCSIRSGTETNHPKTAILDILFLPADIRLLAGSDSTLTLLTVLTSSNMLGIFFGAMNAASLMSNESCCCTIICAVRKLQGTSGDPRSLMFRNSAGRPTDISCAREGGLDRATYVASHRSSSEKQRGNFQVAGAQCRAL